MMNPLEIAGGYQPVRKSAQRLRWFFKSFEEEVQRLSAETGVAYAVDDAVLANVFAEWLKAFNAQKPDTSEDNLAYVGFAAGLMLQSLITRKPVSVSSMPSKADFSKPAFFWPEGYLYVTYCLNVRGLVIRKDFQRQQSPNEALGDIRTWWSFKENVEEDPALAIAFLELFAGEEPDWQMPGLFRPERIRELPDAPRPKELKPAG
ncbi:MAG: hypothetical protein AAGA21_04965 [Pseudomonadota bacterium]